MNDNTLEKLNTIIRKLVDKANGMPIGNSLSKEEAYMLVRAVDLTEGFIRHVDDDYFYRKKVM